MSKIGKKMIIVPKDSSVKSENGTITITGPKGSKQLTVNEKIFSTNVNENNEFNIVPLVTKNIDKKTSIMWGTYRSLINNAVLGVSTGSYFEWRRILPVYWLFSEQGLYLYCRFLCHFCNIFAFAAGHRDGSPIV